MEAALASRPSANRRSPGTSCRISYQADPEDQIEAGDFLRTETGSCYLVDDPRPSPTIPGRYYLRCTRMEPDAVQFGEPGVWPLYWDRRERR